MKCLSYHRQVEWLLGSQHVQPPSNARYLGCTLGITPLLIADAGAERIRLITQDISRNYNVLSLFVVVDKS